ncbi:uncharacterized protein LOC105699974 [Orussus abietinus]|uniref:uncharacterized protein LOC105699974 n=1 Tax=Orussus abietinus TaxID=222816 RepID=UPI000626EB2C|nr:uncharacterized protein LOC105699974 [Orussus abietinus]
MAVFQRLRGLSRLLTSSRVISLPRPNSYYTYLNETSVPLPNKEPCWVKNADEAVAKAGLKSDNKIFVHGAAATPVELLRALTDYCKKCDLSNVRLYHMHLEGDAPYAQPDAAKHIKSVSLFIGGNVRKAVNDGIADCIPIFLHDIPSLFEEGIIIPDIALIHVTEPDSRGYCSLGTSVDCARAAVIHSKTVVAMVNKKMPRTYGDALIHISHIDYAFKFDTNLLSHGSKASTDAEKMIAKHIADNLVEDGATLQMGIGSIPDAVLASLKDHRDLGVHSEMFSDGIIDLVNRGCITNSKKLIHRGLIIGSFCVGSQKLYDFLDNNPFVVMLGVDHTNDPKIIAKQPKMTAINSCIEVDITGQVCSDSIGTRMYSGFGGQVDFISGAAMSDDRLGKPIIAFTSETAKGVSKIQPVLKSGAGVVTSRALVRYVVTEYGIAALFGKTLAQRAYALINIAHPKHRESLEKAAFERLKTMPEP